MSRTGQCTENKPCLQGKRSKKKWCLEMEKQMHSREGPGHSAPGPDREGLVLQGTARSFHSAESEKPVIHVTE